jgi:hypothetical protein
MGGVGWRPSGRPEEIGTEIIFFLFIFFGGLECVGHSFAYVAHL